MNYFYIYQNGKLIELFNWSKEHLHKQYIAYDSMYMKIETEKLVNKFMVIESY